MPAENNHPNKNSVPVDIVSLLIILIRYKALILITITISMLTSTGLWLKQKTLVTKTNERVVSQGFLTKSKLFLLSDHLKSKEITDLLKSLAESDELNDLLINRFPSLLEIKKNLAPQITTRTLLNKLKVLKTNPETSVINVGFIHTDSKTSLAAFNFFTTQLKKKVELISSQVNFNIKVVTITEPRTREFDINTLFSTSIKNKVTSTKSFYQYAILGIILGITLSIILTFLFSFIVEIKKDPRLRKALT